MEEYQIFSDKGETEEIVNYDPIQIEQNEIKYDLNIQNKENMITFSLIDKNQFPSVNYNRTMSFKEIKELNVIIIFQALNSFNDFYDYLKSLSENKKINIRKNNDKISIYKRKQLIKFINYKANCLLLKFYLNGNIFCRNFIETTIYRNRFISF